MIAYFARHRTAANLVLLGIVALGLSALPSLKRETFPDLAADEVEIRAVYPAASAEDVEDAICVRIEDAVDGIDRLEEIRCEAREGLAIATAKMQEGADIDRFTDDVKTEVEAIESFPALVERPVVRQLGRRDFVAAVAVAGPLDPIDLRAYAEDVRARLIRLPLVSQVTLRGFAQPQVRIALDPAALRRHGLTVAAVAEQVRAHNISRPAGFLETDGRDITVRFADQRRTPPGLRDLVVLEGAGGGQVKLSDLGTVHETFANDWDRASFDGQPAVILEVSKSRSEDSLAVMAAIETFLAAERAGAPPGLVLAVTADVASLARDRLDLLTRNGMQGLVLVFLILWLFFSFRYAFWVAAGLPVAFLGTFFVMTLTGHSIDMITMVGLLIAVGLMMDDAIVIAENIAAHRQRGAPPLKAAIDGTRQVFGGVVSSYLTTVCVFGALAFIEGRMGQVLRVMPVVLVITLTVSLIEAFLILPNHLGHAVEHTVKARPSAFRRAFDAGFEALRTRHLGAAVNWAVRWRWLTVGLVFAAVIATLAVPAGGLLKFRAFPKVEGDVAEARLILPAGTPLARTQAVVAAIVAAAGQVDAAYRPQQPDGQPLIRHVSVAYGTNRDAFESGPHVATVTLDLLGAEIRNAPLPEVLAAWRAATGPLPDVLFLRFDERQIGPAGRDLDIRLSGRDLADLDAAAQELMAWLGGLDGVRDLSTDLRPGKPELRLALKPGAAGLGFTADAVAAQVRTALQGTTVDEFQRGGQTVDIDVRLAAGGRDGLGDLDDFVVAAPSGALVPLSEVAEITEARGWTRIGRVNGLRTVSVQGVVDDARGNAQEIVTHLRRAFLPDLLARHPGVSVALEGAAKESAKTGSSVGRNLALGMIGVYLLLAFQFRSYVEPVVVMAAIPVALIGAVWGHVALGIDLSMPSVVGLASLTGVVVNDSILLVLFIKARLAAGEAVETAGPHAARERFRAIVLTSATTVGGLAPLLTETSLQAQVLIPLAASLAFGLSATTLTCLFLVPALYGVLDDLGLSEGKRQRRAREPAV